MQIAVQHGASCQLPDRDQLSDRLELNVPQSHADDHASFGPLPARRLRVMRTQNLSQTQQPDKNVAHEAERNSDREASTSTRHAHWDELHGAGNGSARHFFTNLRQGIAQRPWTDIALAATAGFAVGWLMSSRQRSHAMRDLFIGSLLPTASKKVHHAYDALRDNGTIRDLGNQFSKLKSRW